MDEFIRVFDISLLVTVAVIVVVTIIGSYLRSNRRDACLRSFEGFHVTLERTNGKIIWGVLELESSGLELRYRDAVQDANHVESSYVLYGDEYADIQALFRYVDDLDEDDRNRRRRDLKRSFHPGPGVWAWRNIQHFFSLATDSMTEVLGLVMGTLRKKSAGRYITDTGEAQLKSFGTTVIGSVGRSYDPLLERLVGKKVVVDLLEGEEVHEHVGIFKNYSSDFIELLDIQYPQKQAVPLAAASGIRGRDFLARVDDGVLLVENQAQQPLLIQSLKIGDQEELLNVVVGSGETVELHPENTLEQAELQVRIVRELDIIVPRTRCLVRHRAERHEPELLPEIIFDLGVILTGSSVADAREARLRERLADHPYSALAASNLGAILVQKQLFDEAEAWLEKAYRLRYSLPDNGRRTQMLLSECRRRKTRSPELSSQMTARQSALEASRTVATNASATGLHEPSSPVQTSVGSTQ